MKIHLDVCCLSRPTDDQSQPRIREEAEAIEVILLHVSEGEICLLSSEVLAEEVQRDPSAVRRLAADTLLTLATLVVELDEVSSSRAQDLASLGYGPFDALHLAAAESVPADALLTTDDRSIRRAARGVGKPRVPVRNPVSWWKERRP